MYYLNAFNEMLRKRQRQNMMGGEGYQGDAPPSGPMGASQSGGGMSGVRNALSNPFVSFAASMIPAARAPFALAKLGVSAYDDSQRASENAAMEAARQGFQAREKADYGPPGPEYGPAPKGDVFQNAYEGGMVTNSFNAANMGGTVPDDSKERLSVVSKPDIVSDPMSRGLPVGTALDTFGGGFGGSPAGFGGGFGGGVGTGEFGGNPESASDLGYNQGGMVTPERLMGRAPAPDDGYGALQGGEYVITKAAVERYGKRLLDAINNGTFR